MILFQYMLIGLFMAGAVLGLSIIAGFLLAHLLAMSPRSLRIAFMRWRWEHIWRPIAHFRNWLAVEIAELLTTPDNLWDADDPEQPFDSLEEWADNVGEKEMEVTVLRGLNLKRKTYRIVDKGDEEADYYDRYDIREIPNPPKRRAPGH